MTLVLFDQRNTDFGIVSVFLFRKRYYKGSAMDMGAQRIAIDGGGTKCRLAFVSGAVRHDVQVGSANVSSDLPGALSELSRGLDQLAQKIGMDQRAMTQIPAYVGLAGVTGPDLAGHVAKALPFSDLLVQDDRPAAVRGALGLADGAVIHCGTGSFFAVQRKRQIRLAGGWGSVLGDEASAMWLGRKALGMTLSVADAVSAESSLTRQLLDQFGATSEIVLFAATATPADFGRVAPMVTAAASNDDITANALMQQGADHVAEQIIALGWQEQMLVMLTGGVAPSYADWLPAKMQRELAQPLGAPIDGALSLALDVAKERVA